MGANQSSDASNNNGPGRRAPGEMKTCYYELLGIDRQASEDEYVHLNLLLNRQADTQSRIKKAYRKKALELHPDRNYRNVEATTKQFADVQSAYEILSDPQERAWYDSHRDAILRDEDDVSGDHYEHNVRITTADDIMRMFTGFRGKLDFTDSDTGFHTTLRRTFDTLAREEELACEWEGLDHITYPSFGHADDAYEDVVRSFYAVWHAFATKKSFSWEDVYRYSEAPDRRVRRMMEKENRRFRDEGIRVFNDAVRSLVAFVKKRDPRVKTSILSEAERQKLLRGTAVAQAARSRAANQARQSQHESTPGWMRPGEEQEPEFSDESEEAAHEHIECVVCKKSFKSEKQYEAHEKSRKHVRAVQHLKRQMQQEDKDLQLEELDSTSTQQPSVNHAVEPGDVEVVPDEEVVVEQKHETNILKDASKSSPQKSLDISSPIEANDSSESSLNDDYTRRETREEHIFDAQEAAADEDIDNLPETLASKSLDQASDASVQPKIGKAKEKRANKAFQKSGAGAVSEADFKCAACQLSFLTPYPPFHYVVGGGDCFHLLRHVY